MSKHKSKDKKRKHKKKHSSKHKKVKKHSKDRDESNLTINNERKRTYSHSSSSSSSTTPKKTKKTSQELIKTDDSDMNVPLDLMGSSKMMRPQTQEEWEKSQNKIKKVLDPETGRYRLIKGDGEVLEEIVSRAQHKEINKKATAFDGEYFESKTVKK
uniref:ADP-ribosylation factor-like protein 6-interacting protein 4 n=1 Tax=Xenopsylla cheopis TaxID=163159 RepID=A0A6M2DGT4_XENCH